MLIVRQAFGAGTLYLNNLGVNLMNSSVMVSFRLADLLRVRISSYTFETVFLPYSTNRSFRAYNFI